MTCALRTIVSNAMTSFKVTTVSTVLRFNQPNFIKRKQVINKRVIRSEHVNTEIEITITVKETVAKSSSGASLPVLNTVLNNSSTTK